ncbi:MAG: hypothetical protein ISS28_03135 [Candidatus Cloacimonetes bacterium]|nr:hypothetical protein [Candidatus Cloacimonadota bacterium]
MVEIQSKRCKELYSEIVQSLSRIKFKIIIDKLTALSFIHLGLPSEVLRYYYYYKEKKKINDIGLAIALMRIDSLRKLNDSKWKYKVIMKKNPFKCLYLKYIKSPRIYNSLKNTILKKSEELKDKCIQEKIRRDKNIAIIEKRVDNFKIKTMINSIKSINNKIYELAEINPNRAFQLSKIVNENLLEIEKIFLKEDAQNQEIIL